MSVLGAVAASPAAKHPGRSFATRPDGSLDAGAGVAFLRDRPRHLPGTVVVAWDGGPNHKGPLARDFLTRNKRRTRERLPACGPDRNPVEAAGSWLKCGQRANDAPDGLPAWDGEVVERMGELEGDPGLRKALRERPDLPLPNGSNEERCSPAGQ